MNTISLVLLQALLSLLITTDKVHKNHNHSFKNKNIIMQTSIDSLAGFELFLKSPNQYNFLCTATSKGEVISATFTEDGSLAIQYTSFWEDGDHSGKVKGKYDRKSNRFRGTYKTHDGRFSGEINFSFNQKGEADGTWDNGYGKIRMHLKTPKK